MSEWHPEIVRIGAIYPHPNKNSTDPALRCDTLSVTEVQGGYPVLFRTGEFKEGDLATYIPVDTVVPENSSTFAFLGEFRRIKAKRMRGVFSMGMLIVAPSDAIEGTPVAESMGLVKYEPSEEKLKMANGENIPGPVGWEFSRYTDIEALRRYRNVLTVGEDVVITEKIHGQNARLCWDPDEKRLWVGSRTMVKKRDGTVNWWNVVNKLDLEEKLAKFPRIIFFGEIYGKSIQNLTYGLAEKAFAIFDSYDSVKGCYKPWVETEKMTKEMGLNTVPVLYKGPWQGYDTHVSLAEGKSTIADHVREGFVVQPDVTRWDHKCGRVILKHIGEGYLLRSEKKK